MMLWLVYRHEDGCCPVVETARVTEEEAIDYIAAQEMLFGAGEDAPTWTVEDVDCPLSREAVAHA